MRRLLGDSGQTLVFGVLFLCVVGLPLFVSMGLALPALMRASAGTAADAAALAGAQHATVTEQVDALGNVYGYAVEIDTAPAETAAWSQWQADASLLLGSATTAWSVHVDNSPPPGQPPTMTILANVTYDDWLLAIAGGAATQVMRFQVTAGTCAATRWPGDASPWCANG